MRMRTKVLTVVVVAALASLALTLGPPREVTADGGCKRDGQQCATNVSCCSGKCINPTLTRGAALFGICCTPTTCAAQGKTCGTIPNGDCTGFTLNCGSCTAPQTCGGGGTPNVCGTTTTTTTTTTTATTSTAFPTCSELLGHCGASSCSGGCVAHQPDNTLGCVDTFTCQFPLACSSDADCAGGGACFSDGSGHTACCTSGCACTPASCLGTTTTTTLPSPCGGQCAGCGTCGAGVCVVAGGTSCGHLGAADVCVDGHTCIASNCIVDTDCDAGTVCVIEGHGAHLCCSTCS